MKHRVLKITAIVYRVLSFFAAIFVMIPDFYFHNLRSIQSSISSSAVRLVIIALDCILWSIAMPCFKKFDLIKDLEIHYFDTVPILLMSGLNTKAALNNGLVKYDGHYWIIAMLIFVDAALIVERLVIVLLKRKSKTGK